VRDELSAVRALDTVRCTRHQPADAGRSPPGTRVPGMPLALPSDTCPCPVRTNPST
jgi:hypothetical protein